jgi:hypothetical protein
MLVHFFNIDTNTAFHSRAYLTTNYLLCAAAVKRILRNIGSVGKGKGKGKAIPLQAWTGPEGSRRLRLPDFKTFSR